MEFESRGVRVHKAIPAAQTKDDALRAEREARETIDAGLFNTASTITNFANFFDTVFLPWAKDTKKSWRHDEFRGRYLVEFFGKMKLAKVQPMHIEKYKQFRLTQKSQRGRVFTPASVNRDLQLLSKMMSMAFDNGIIRQNPCARVHKFREGMGRERFLTREEEGRLLNIPALNYPHLTAVVILAVNTGLRKSELLTLRFEHCNLSKNAKPFDLGGTNVQIPAGFLLVEPRKTEKHRIIPIVAVVRAELEKLREGAPEKEFVFTNERTGAGYAEIKKGFQAACKAAEIPFGQAVPNGLTFHDLRHTFATRLREAEVSEFDIADLLGHSSIKMTRRYAHGQASTLQRAVDKISGDQNHTPDTKTGFQPEEVKNPPHFHLLEKTA